MQKEGEIQKLSDGFSFFRTKFIIVKNQKNKTSEYIKVIMRSSIKKMMLRHVVYIVFTGKIKSIAKKTFSLFLTWYFVSLQRS